MKSLVLLTDDRAPSFCYYDSPAPGPRTVMSPEVFSAALDYARRSDLALQLICGADGLPAELAELLGDQPVVRYGPPSACTAVDDVPVVEASAPEAIDELHVGRHPIGVLRVGREDFERLPAVWRRFAERVGRVVLVLSGLKDELDEASLIAYDTALEAIRVELAAAYRSGENAELNAVTDRIVLREPRQCNAGLDHVTVGVDGDLHICPGFARDGAPAVGTIGNEPDIPNKELLTLERAPICSVCDAFQCRRCVYLNQRCTLEVNTPPSQVCRTAHREREAARTMLDDLHARDMLTNLDPIEPIWYDDPLELLLVTGGAPKRTPPRVRPLRPRTADPHVPSAEPVPNGLEHIDSPPATAMKEVPAAMPADPKDPTTPAPGLLPNVEPAPHDDVIGRVTPSERDTIRQLHITKRGLTELFTTLCNLPADQQATTPLYERIVKDIGLNTTEYEDWWVEMGAKYGWPNVNGMNWAIDFANCEIHFEPVG